MHAAKHSILIRVAASAYILLLASCMTARQVDLPSEPVATSGVPPSPPRMSVEAPPVGGQWATISNGVAVLPHTNTRHVLPRALFGLPPNPSLRSVSDRLTTALEAASYGSRYKFYEIPGGFILVTALEQVGPDGEFLPNEDDRWSLGFPSIDYFSFADVAGALFLAPEGHYRMIMFVVASEIDLSGAEPTPGVAEVLSRGGRVILPDDIADLPLSDSHEMYALVYQFRRVGHYSDADVSPDGAPNARHHLEQSGILAGLQ